MTDGERAAAMLSTETAGVIPCGSKYGKALQAYDFAHASAATVTFGVNWRELARRAFEQTALQVRFECGGFRVPVGRGVPGPRRPPQDCPSRRRRVVQR